MSKTSEKLDKSMNILRVIIGICVISIIVTVIATNLGGKKDEPVTKVEEKPTETIVPTQTVEPTVTPAVTIEATATQQISPTQTPHVSPTPGHTPVKVKDTGPKPTVKPTQKKVNTPPRPTNTPKKPANTRGSDIATPTPEVLRLNHGS
jgi:hypothetical protein